MDGSTSVSDQQTLCPLMRQVPPRRRKWKKEEAALLRQPHAGLSIKRKGFHALPGLIPEAHVVQVPAAHGDLLPRPVGPQAVVELCQPGCQEEEIVRDDLQRRDVGQVLQQCPGRDGIAFGEPDGGAVHAIRQDAVDEDALRRTVRVPGHRLSRQRIQFKPAVQGPDARHGVQPGCEGRVAVLAEGGIPAAPRVRDIAPFGLDDG